MSLIYIDPITKKRIEYHPDDIFTIMTRYGGNKKTVRKIIKASDIASGLQEFYAMLIPSHAYKFFFHIPYDRKGHEGNLILRMKGHLAPDQIALKETKKLPKMQTETIGTLNYCPKSMAIKLRSEDLLQYPASTSKWSYHKIFYCVLAKYLDMPHEEKMKFISDGEEALIQHKLKSGFNLEEDHKIKVDIVNKFDELL